MITGALLMLPVACFMGWAGAIMGIRPFLPVGFVVVATSIAFMLIGNHMGLP